LTYDNIKKIIINKPEAATKWGEGVIILRRLYVQY
jgi:hypothetical protein